MTLNGGVPYYVVVVMLFVNKIKQGFPKYSERVNPRPKPDKKQQARSNPGREVARIVTLVYNCKEHECLRVESNFNHTGLNLSIVTCARHNLNMLACMMQAWSFNNKYWSK